MRTLFPPRPPASRFSHRNRIGASVMLAHEEKEDVPRSPLQREGTPLAPKPQCKSSGPQSLKSKPQTQPMLENFPAPSLLTFPCQILIGQVAYLSLSVCLNPPSGSLLGLNSVVPIGVGQAAVIPQLSQARPPP
ncbi:hypothetical protein ROHU_035137 [Labeo rohita]|uniref:Uncharacterized protein n=1 Tax=Labeo rohita TaxID=84645 RepID=A0A498LHN2_LABRO|nr:hypothetical protein ROHU_035137 [Labeo rohita]